jgi:EAL domain-containing protein (putative c-di-GMP-specific phosphodiesterase class I)
VRRGLSDARIAEWLEDAQTFRALQALDADDVQGFGVARPQEAKDILMASSAASFVTSPELVRLLRSEQSPLPGINDQSIASERAV